MTCKGLLPQWLDLGASFHLPFCFSLAESTAGSQCGLSAGWRGCWNTPVSMTTYPGWRQLRSWEPHGSSAFGNWKKEEFIAALSREPVFLQGSGWTMLVTLRRRSLEKILEKVLEDDNERRARTGHSRTSCCRSSFTIQIHQKKQRRF